MTPGQFMPNGFVCLCIASSVSRISQLEAPSPKGGMPIYYFGHIPRKLHEIEKNGPRKREARVN